MTLEKLVTRARQLSRVDSTGASDSVLIQLFEAAARQFSHDVHGFPKEEYHKVSASFDVTTDYALNVTITGGTNAMTAADVVVTASDLEDATGAEMASALQTALRAAVGAGADLTVSFTNFYFYIETSASTVSTDITIASPDAEDYIDAQELLGLSGSLDEDATGQFNGDFPYGCTRRLTLDRRPITIQAVFWDDYQLQQAPRGYFERDDYAGSPCFYYNEGKDLIITPAPNEQKELYVAYKAEAELDTYQGYQECGLTGKTNQSASGLSATTQYYFKAAIDGGVSTEYDITTTANVTFESVITLMNAEITGAEFSISGGDLRCTSDELGSDSYIQLAAGTSGTDLFGALTGFTAFETAVPGTSTLPNEIEDQWHNALAYWVAAELLMGTFEEEHASKRRGVYYTYVRDYLVEYGNRNTSLGLKEPKRLWWRYGGRD